MVDQSWSYQNNQELNLQIQVYQQQILNNTPTLSDIVNANIAEQDRMLAIQTYQTFYQVGLTDLYSQEWFQLRKRIINLLAKTMSKEEQELRQVSLVTTTIKQQIIALPAPVLIRKRLFQMYETMTGYDDDSHVKEKLKTKIKWLLSLPYNTLSTIDNDIQSFCLHVYAQLNASIFGMTHVKEKLLFSLHNRLRHQHPANVLALKGLPGVGKTKLIQVFAKAVGRYYEKISFGGITDSTVLLGSDPVWSGSGPSVLLQILARAKVADPIVALDEIDKTSDTPRGREVHHALLHIL
ncbi:MAG TPA: AAA family ATPase, partial [Ferruginibacter sp.]|nr:AAA family ATPase [Ferruginibacter sp.]